MDHRDWFRSYIQEYRRIIDENYAEKKDLFPWYSPTEINVYVVDDDKGIFPEVIVFFSKIDEYSQNFLSNDVYVFKEKIKWPNDFDDMDRDEQEMEILAVEYDTFIERRFPLIHSEGYYRLKDFEADPKDKARIKVHEHLLSGFRRGLIEAHMEITQLRSRKFRGNDLTAFLSNLKDLENLSDDVMKGKVISQAFWLLGFETMNLEKLKELPEYKALNNIPHVDVLAFLLPDRFLVAVEEGKITKDRWFKQSTLKSTFDVLKIPREKWRTFFLWIGKESRSIIYLEGNARILSYEDFFTILNRFLHGRSGYPNLTALWALFGSKTRLFNIP